MKLGRSTANALLLMFLLASGACALVAAPPTVPARLVGAYTPTANDWNGAIVDVYTYLNTNVVAALNLLTAKGDTYTYDGTALKAQTVGDNDDVLIADSTTTTGLRWGVTTGMLLVEAKGDLQIHDGSTIQRLPVGANGYALSVVTSEPLGVGWVSLANDVAFPKGSIVAWSPTFAGTGTPDGYLVCDGTSGTPNLIGRFVLGTRPNGSSASPSAGGFGAKTADATSGTANHTHTFSLAGTPNNETSTEISTVEVLTGSGATIAAGSHKHTITSSAPTSAASNQPASYAIVYLMKQ
jgi:hypothetical protein